MHFGTAKTIFLSCVHGHLCIIKNGTVPNMKRREIILFSVLAAAAVCIILVVQWKKHTSPPASRIRIEISGSLFGEYDLSKDQSIDINGHNLLQISNGSAFMTEADCPDHLCIRQFRIDHIGDTIICLPNKVVVIGLGETDQAPLLDGVAG